MKTLREFKQSLDEASDNRRTLVDRINAGVPSKLKPYVRVVIERLGSSKDGNDIIRVDVVGAGKTASKPEMSKTRVATYTLELSEIDSGAVVFKYTDGSLDKAGVKPMQLRKSKTAENAIDLLNSWLNKNDDALVEYIHTTWSK